MTELLAVGWAACKKTKTKTGKNICPFGLQTPAFVQCQVWNILNLTLRMSLLTTCLILDAGVGLRFSEGLTDTCVELLLFSTRLFLCGLFFCLLTGNQMKSVDAKRAEL